MTAGRRRSPGPSRIRVWDEALENPFEEENRRRAGLGKAGRLYAALAVALLAAMAFCVLFRYDVLHNPVTLSRYLAAVEGRLGELWGLLAGAGQVNAVGYAVCTAAVVAVVGACLACCGAVCQGVFHTPMASPSMLGIQSGGMVAAVLYLLFCYDDSATMQFYTFEEYTSYLDTLGLLDIYGQQIWMIAGCFLGALAVVFISSRAGGGKVSSVVLILAGSLFGSLANTVVSLGQWYFTYVDSTTNRVYALMSISTGTFANTYTPQHLLMVGVPVLVCLGVLFALAPGLNALMFGDEEARGMGMNVGVFRTVVFALCVVPCGVVLSFCGQIAFVGLIVPHFARQMAGSDYRRLLPASALAGGLAMELVYAVALCTGFTTSINLVASIVGGGLFLAFVLRYRRSRNADWA